MHETRAYLAHGEIKATAQGISISHITFNGKCETRFPPKALTRLQMLKALSELEDAQKRLHQQLGHIKALAGQTKPKPGA